MRRIVAGARRIVAASLAVAVAGCTLVGGGASPAADDAAATGQSASVTTDAPATDTRRVADYLELMRDLIDGDPLTQAAAFSDAEAAADIAPTTANRLKYALALSVPGHGGSDADAAVSLLRTLLATGDALLPEERMLATIQLGYAEEIVVIRQAAEQRIAELERQAETASTDNEALVGQLREEIRQLRTDLDEATEMLDAITTIERSLSEREQESETP